ncbi:MAG: hypothetical protein J0M18_13830 [Ignavibacteria bacterium]|nr:hypothetical protein [Ignavibacteria bacterium]
MISSGNIIHIENFDFEDGSEPKNKFFLVIYCEDETATIVQVFPTSQGSHTSAARRVHGCNNQSVHFYLFTANTPVAEKGDGSPYSFSKDTYIYLRNVIVSTSSKLSKYTSQMKLVAKLTDAELTELIKCLKGSNQTLNEVKNIL